jgi:hypothetical protein
MTQLFNNKRSCSWDQKCQKRSHDHAGTFFLESQIPWERTIAEHCVLGAHKYQE